MNWARWIERPRLLALLSLAFALVPAGLALVTYRDARQKDQRLFTTTSQVLREQLQRVHERHTYFLGVMRNQARGLSESARAAGRMTSPNFPWQEKLPHLLGFGYARVEGDALRLAWSSAGRDTGSALGDDLLQLPALAAAWRRAAPAERMTGVGAFLDARRFLVLLPVAGEPERGVVVGWLDLAGLCRDASVELLAERVLTAEPLREDQPAPARTERLAVRDGAIRWDAAIGRGPAFRSEFGPPTPWLAFLAVGFSAVPLVVLTMLAGRAERLRGALETERQLVRQQRFLTQSVSHEFRTPLSIILSGTELLEHYLEQLSPERRAELWREIKDNTKHMNDLVEQVLLLGRIDSGRQACQPRPVDVAVLCADSVRTVRAATRDRCPVTTTVPALTVPLDPGLFTTLLGNLLTNAVKYSHPGQPVALSVTSTDGQLVLTVTDTGIGIPAEDLPRLGDAFHRGQNTGGLPGSGLGLTIVRRCAELHGGTLSLESTEGRGTVVTVRLPLGGGS